MHREAKSQMSKILVLLLVVMITIGDQPVNAQGETPLTDEELVLVLAELHIRSKLRRLGAAGPSCSARSHSA